MKVERSTTVALIGAGPIGIEMAVALQKEGIPYEHIEAGCIGATIDWWAPGTVFFSSSDRISIAGVPLHNTQQSKASREEYLCYLRSVVEQFALAIETYTRVTTLSQTETGWKLGLTPSHHGVGGPSEQACLKDEALAPREIIHAKKVILAIGDMHRPRLLGIPGEELPHVSHFFSEPHRFFGKRVLIVGGMNSAIEAAIRLVRVGAKVSLSYRGPALNETRIKFWLLPDVKSLIRRNLLHFLPNTEPQRIGSDSVTLVDRTAPDKKNKQEIAADFVLLLTGYEQDPTLYQQAAVHLEGEGNRPVLNLQTMESSQAGLYSIGTGAAGTQIGGVTEFIETSHVHVKRVLAHLQGKPAPLEETPTEISQREI